MKLRNILLAATVAASSLMGCTHRFEEINDNPWTSNDIDVKHIMAFSQAKMYASGHEAWRSSIIMGGAYAQNTACAYSTGIGFTTNDGYTEPTFSLLFKDIIKNIEDSKVRLEQEEGVDHYIAQFDIIKVVNMLRATELYGDIPYSTAGKGFTEGIYYPVYESQEEVLEMMVTDLLNARTAIKASSAEQFTSHDAYDASTDKKDQYTKLANSLLIKIGMLMSEANPSRGAEIFKMGYNDDGGYISSWADASYVRHVEAGGPWGQHVNGIGIAVEGQVGGFSHAYLSEVALKYMQANHDPRIFRLVAHCDVVGGVSKAVDNPSLYHNFDPFAQAGAEGEFKKVHFRGLRFGDNGDGNRGLFYRKDTDATQQASFWRNQNAGDRTEYTFQNEGQFITLAGMNPATFNRTMPSIIVGADEIAFLIAEASTIPAYGINDNDAFRRGVELAISKYDALGFGGGDYENNFSNLYKEQTNPDYNHNENKTQYVNDAVARYNAAADKRDIVVTEHWLSQIGNGYTSFTLVNRTGGPSFLNKVVPVEARDYDLPSYDKDPIENTDANLDGTFEVVLHRGGVTDYVRPSRFPYPNKELNANGDNVSVAMQRQRGSISEATHFIAVPQWYSKK
ncbi:SusD/RagB family nutrient-binding outer membrane lipoprotein [Flammeovirga sp. SJP92]|uniref:SusD/RagB family nutrient-binding outer membrane lipoprotein n=1 Tax=Flammeovirga sp. SJP92 TaxID=1775430 RepID=UPI0007898DDB|nr:SusD/RagB family nutrient-binding outer membrane lipoprotein [Flammeovirga sp. SJP92]KXX69681.1 hypothetical protein AVL50_12360 [Flammeovirga sp. SJP92]